jgi:hypothetical protein
MAFGVTSLQQMTIRRSSYQSKGPPQGCLVVEALQCEKIKSTIISSFRAAAHGLTGAGPPYVVVMVADGSVIMIVYKNLLRRRVCFIHWAR